VLSTVSQLQSTCEPGGQTEAGAEAPAWAEPAAASAMTQLVIEPKSLFMMLQST
jgi:hypothetical protein